MESLTNVKPDKFLEKFNQMAPYPPARQQQGHNDDAKDDNVEEDDAEHVSKLRLETG